MALISPFQAWRYAPQRVPVAQVVTQPYDKITPEMQERYYAANPSNLVRIILGQRMPGDNASENVYTRATANFKRLARSRASCVRTPQPSRLSLHPEVHRPRQRKTPAERQGYIALGRLEDYSAGVVFRHELTHSGPKADRLELLRATRTHFEQIFMLYADSGAIEKLLLQSDAAPDIEVTDEYGVLHRFGRSPTRPSSLPCRRKCRTRS